MYEGNEDKIKVIKDAKRKWNETKIILNTWRKRIRQKNEKKKVKEDKDNIRIYGRKENDKWIKRE